jgi:hypothetical protein
LEGRLCRDNSNNTREDCHWKPEKIAHAFPLWRIISHIGACMHKPNVFFVLSVQFSLWFSNNFSIYS